MLRRIRDMKAQFWIAEDRKWDLICDLKELVEGVSLIATGSLFQKLSTACTLIITMKGFFDWEWVGKLRRNYWQSGIVEILKEGLCPLASGVHC